MQDIGTALSGISFILCCGIGQVLMVVVPVVVIWKIIESKRKARREQKEFMGTIYRSQKATEEFFNSLKQEPPVQPEVSGLDIPG